MPRGWPGLLGRLRLPSGTPNKVTWSNSIGAGAGATTGWTREVIGRSLLNVAILVAVLVVVLAA